MLQKSNYGKFGSLAVFPGGSSHKVDQDNFWKTKLPPNMYSPHIITALRETFEESGLLICKDKISLDLVSWRKKTIKEPQEFVNMIKSNNVDFDYNNIALYSNWYIIML